MHEQSFFSILTRYRPSVDRLPREDSLTQCFTALLGLAPELARRVAMDWTGWGCLPPDEPKVHSQVPTGTLTGRRIDLEILFGDDTVVWVEVKHGSPPSGAHQLELYSDDLEVNQKGRRALVFLPPAGSPTPAHLPSSASIQFVESDWQRTGRAVSDWVARQDPNAMATRLAADFVQFLTEEGLFVTKGFTDEDRAVLECQQQAQNSFTRLISDVRQRVAQRVEAHPDLPSTPFRDWPPRPRWGVLYSAWEAAKPGEPWLEWHLNTGDPGDDGDWAFSAGLGAHSSDDLDGLISDGFERFDAVARQRQSSQ